MNPEYLYNCKVYTMNGDVFVCRNVRIYRTEGGYIFYWGNRFESGTFISLYAITYIDYYVLEEEDGYGTVMFWEKQN